MKKSNVARKKRNRGRRRERSRQVPVHHDGVMCGECGALMELRSSRFGPFYGCTRWPECKGTHGAHPDGAPHGTPGNAETRAARIRAHAVFDGARPQLGLSRRQSYRWLAALMELPAGAAHISMFDAEQCAELERRVNAALYDFPAAGEPTEVAVWKC